MENNYMKRFEDAEDTRTEIMKMEKELTNANNLRAKINVLEKSKKSFGEENTEIVESINNRINQLQERIKELDKEAFDLIYKVNEDTDLDTIDRLELYIKANEIYKEIGSARDYNEEIEKLRIESRQVEKNIIDKGMKIENLDKRVNFLNAKGRRFFKAGVGEKIKEVIEWTELENKYKKPEEDHGSWEEYRKEEEDLEK